MSFKVVLLGSSNVGKSSTVLRFVKGLEIWDTAGQERYRSLAPMYYRGAAAAIIVYDITSKDSFTVAQEWVQELRRSGPEDVIMALVGNKLDLEAQRELDRAEGSAYAESQNLIFAETSAKTGHGIEELFVAIASQLPTNHGPAEDAYDVDLSNDPDMDKETGTSGKSSSTSSGKCPCQ